MSWIKLDDQFADHPKVVAAGPLAAWLYVCGLTYCGRYLTDGWIPEGQVRKLADIDDATAQAQRLVDVGLWERVDDGYLVHDYLEYNPTGERVKAERAANARRQAEWRERNRQDNGQFGDDVTDTEPERNAPHNGERNAVTDAAVTTAPSPSPSPSPSPIPSDTGDARRGASAPPPANNGDSQPETEAEPEPEREKPKTPPAILAFRSSAHRYPAKSWWKRVDAVVGDAEPDVERWQKLVFEWVGNGWNPTNVKGMLDAYQSGGIQPASRGSPKKPTQSDRIAQIEDWVAQELGGN